MNNYDMAFSDLISIHRIFIKLIYRNYGHIQTLGDEICVASTNLYVVYGEMPANRKHDGQKTGMSKYFKKFIKWL